MASVEMSNYIDLEKYHKAERTHPFYEEMLAEILSEMKKHLNGEKTRVLELGSGTGIATLELLKFPSIDLTAVEVDENCFSFLQGKLNGTDANLVLADAVIFKCNKVFDITVSVFAHDHVSFERAREFAENINKNLKMNGLYIMGGELLFEFKTEYERKQALKKYHGFIIEKAEKEGNKEIVELETEALNSGLNKIGDFKRSEKMLEREMENAGFKVVKKEKMGPKKPENIGGVFVYIFQKVREI